MCINSLIKMKQVIVKMAELMMKHTIFIIYLFECSFLSLIWFNAIQPHEFIDEHFHLEQTRAYCQGNFTQVKFIFN